MNRDVTHVEAASHAQGNGEPEGMKLTPRARLSQPVRLWTYFREGVAIVRRRAEHRTSSACRMAGLGTHRRGSSRLCVVLYGYRRRHRRQYWLFGWIVGLMPIPKRGKRGREGGA